MCTKILAAVPGLAEANLIDVADGIGTQLINDTLEVKISHRFTVDLLVQVVELTDQSATVDTKLDRLQLFQSSIV